VVGNDRDEMTLVDVCRILKKHRYLVFLMVGFTVAVAAAVSFVMPKVYEARAVILPVESQQPGMAGMKAAAAQLGVGPSDNSKESEIVNLLKSNILREQIIRRHDLLPVFFTTGRLEGMTKQERIWEGIRHLDDSLSVKPDSEYGSIELAMQDGDPEVAAEVLGYALAELTDHMSDESRRVAETNRRYLEGLIGETSDPIIRARIYSLIAEQIETAMMAEVKENFAFKVIDPPKAPVRSIKPRKLMNIAVAFVLSSFLAVVAAFVKEHIEKAKAFSEEGESR
jgi:uncharacterized protein involved in exopolysaccharide biosynthesis